MKHILLFPFLLIVICAQSQSTEEYKDSTKFYSHVHLGFGYQNQSFSSLNARLTSYFPRSIPGNTLSLHYGGKSVMDRFLLQGDMNVAFSTNGNRNEGRTSLFLFSLGADAGFMLTKPGSVRIYPFAGLSIDAPLVTAKIRSDNINFDSVLANPFTRASLEPISLSNFFFSWRGGLGIDFGSKKHPQHPYTLGIRLGYKQSFHSGRWRLSGESALMNAPSDNLEQWFGTLVFYSPVSKMARRKKD